MHYPASITAPLISVLHQHPLHRLTKPPRRLPCTSCESTLFPLDNLGGTLLGACHLRRRHDVVITAPAAPPFCSSLLRLFRLMIFSAPFNNSEKLISTIHFAHSLSSWQELFMLPRNSPGWKRVQEEKGGKKKTKKKTTEQIRLDERWVWFVSRWSKSSQWLQLKPLSSKWNLLDCFQQLITARQSDALVSADESSLHLGSGRDITFAFRAFIRRFCPHIHTLMAVAAMQGDDQADQEQFGVQCLVQRQFDMQTRGFEPATF